MLSFPLILKIQHVANQTSPTRRPPQDASLAQTPRYRIGICRRWARLICRARRWCRGHLLGDAGHSWVPIDNVGPRLPVAAEQYVLATRESRFPAKPMDKVSCRFSIRVVEADRDSDVWEPTFAIHTSLLDTAPSLETQCRGESRRRVAAKFRRPRDFRGRLRGRFQWFRRFAIRTQTAIDCVARSARRFRYEGRCSTAGWICGISASLEKKACIRKTRPWVILIARRRLGGI